LKLAGSSSRATNPASDIVRQGIIVLRLSSPHMLTSSTRPPTVRPSILLNEGSITLRRTA